MRKKKGSNGAAPIAILGTEDLAEFRMRRALVEQSRVALMAAASWHDAFHFELVEKYELPDPRFNVDLETGYITEASDAKAIGV